LRRKKQSDGIYYLLDAEKCVKIHSYQQQAYLDFRRYRKDDTNGSIVTKWVPEIKPVPIELIIDKLKLHTELALKGNIDSAIIM